MRALALASILLWVALAGAPALACTGITVKTTDGSVISARTLEFADDIHSDVILIPRGYAMSAVLPDGRRGLTWTQKYATLGANALGQPALTEGFNEKGLSIGAFYFPGYAGYAKLTPENAGRALLSVDFMGWLLGNFATIPEVKANLDRAVVVEGSRPGITIPAPLHYRVTDAAGNVIVIEHVDGQTNVYDDALGVISDSPTFDWHMTNLRNYVNLSAVNVPKVALSGKEFQKLGQGSGMLGLPGDFTPPSRLVRALALQVTALPVKTADEGVNLAWNILSNITIPIGTVRDVAPDGTVRYGYTQWANVSDLTNRRFYFRTYGNQNLRMVSLADLPVDGKEIMVIAMEAPPQYRNVSAEARVGLG